MCGIFGFAKSEKALSGIAEHQMRGVVMDLACLNESRGKDGTGLALMGLSESIVFKQAKPVSELLKTRKFREVLRQITSKTLLCLGHTRLATVGSVHNNHCHPFVSQDFVGVHNGHFLNRESLLKKYQKTAETPVDSEAIFRVLDGEQSVSGMIARLREMSGDFALGFAGIRDPYRLYLVRNEERPLHVAYVKALEVLFWSSESEHLEFALLRNDLDAKVYELQVDQLYCADVRQFNGKSNMTKHTCRIEPSQWPQLTEEDFTPSDQPYLFDFEELESSGFLEGAGITEQSKIPCAGCNRHIAAGKLFYDETARHFVCERCSCDYQINWHEEPRREE